MFVRAKMNTLRKMIKYLFYIGIAVSAFLMWTEQREMISAETQEEETGVRLSPMRNEAQKDGIVYYDLGVRAMVPIEKESYDSETIQIVAIPKDSVADSSVRQSENEGDSGEYVIPGWEADENESGYEVNFCFEEDGKWQLQIHCGEERDYYSDVFVIDKKEPILTVSYGNISAVHGDCHNVTNVNKVIRRDQKRITSSECEAYTKKRGLISIEVTEDYFLPEEADIKIYQMNYEKDSQEEVTGAYIDGKPHWGQNENNYTLMVNIEEEGHYRIQLDYRDPAGWKMAGKGEEESSCMKDGNYLGPVYTVDQTVPVIQPILYQNEPERNELERSYFVQEPVMIIQIIEENFNQADFRLQDQLFYANGNRIAPPLDEGDYSLKWTSRYVDGKRINETALYVKEQANHTFNIQTEDGSGRISDSIQEEVTYDKEPPVIHYRADRLQEGDILLDPENVWFLPYRSYRYFSQKKIRFTVTAKDEISGVRAIRCYCTDENGNRVWNSLENVENAKKDVKAEDLGEFHGEFVLDWDDFKGNFHVVAEDYSGIQCQEIQGEGMVSESAQLHERAGKLEIKMPEAAYTDEKKKIKYYNQPLNVEITGEDSHSGIRELKISACEEKGKHSEPKKSITVRKEYSEQEDVVYRGEKTLAIKGTLFADSRVENPVQIEATLTDNAGHTSKKKYDYKAVIDCENPEISVEYDDYHASNGRYYNRTRTAMVTVKDWNFNPSAVEWQMSGSNKKYHIGKWTGDGEIHQCNIVFDQDGEDYKIKLTVTDYAGNRAQWDEDSVFTIDKTPPLIELKMNKEDIRNEKYFSSTKNVFLTVKDRNIAKEEVDLHIRAKRDGKKLSMERNVEITENKTDDSRYDVRMLFQKDGDYRIAAQCRDLAGNVSEILRIEEFTIDRTSPHLQISGLERGMAYNGNLSPRVSCTDRNWNANTFRAEIYRMDGFQGKALLRTQKQIQRQNEKGIQIQWEDFPHKRWADGIYALKLSGEDLAGNRIGTEEGIPFYVNRFGAIYSLEQSTGEILKKGYLRQEEDLILREISVTDTDIHISVWKDNQERKDLSETVEEGQKADYQIIDGDTSEYTNGKRGWHEKTYRILKKNFEDEGVYQVTVYSLGYVWKNGEKKGIKETTNDLQHQSVRFTVDKTPPVVRISGLEERVYEGNRHAMIITAMDNYEMERMEIRIHYENGEKKEDVYQFTSEDFDENHSVKLELGAYTGEQTVSYLAWDRAGNCSDSAKTGKNISCIISNKKKVSDNHDKKSFFPEGAALLIAIGGMTGLVLIARKKSNVPNEKRKG